MQLFDRMTTKQLKENMKSVFPGRDIACVFIHHTASRRQYWHGKESVIAIHNYHKAPPPNGRGWWGIGYNFVVDCNEPDVVWAGRPLSRTGAHALIKSYAKTHGPRWSKYTEAYPNLHGVGISIPGDYRYDSLNPECYNTLVEATGIICERFNISMDMIGYHEEVQNKVCPGSDYKFPKLVSFKSLVKASISGGEKSKLYFNDEYIGLVEIVDGTSFVTREVISPYADKYNLTLPDGDTFAIRMIATLNYLPPPTYAAETSSIYLYTPDEWANVRLIVNDKSAGRVWMLDGKGAGEVSQVTLASGWPFEKFAKIREGRYVRLRDIQAAYPDKTLLSTDYWSTERKVYLYLASVDFDMDAKEAHELTDDPTQPT